MNKRTQEKTKTTGILYNSVIVLLILIIAISSCIGTFAWAKYTSSINGTTTAQIAKWSFKVIDGVTETTDEIEFAFTRTDGYGKVAEGKLAPGTFGEFQIGIDARGTETILEYIIDVELENKPTYLKFYKDAGKTEEISVTDNKLTIEGFMSLEDVKEIRTETIYWDWPYENGDDEQDTQDAGKLVTMQVSVTGYEVLEPPTESDNQPDEETIYTLADVVSVGDYVNYDASSNGVRTFTSSECLDGTSISSTISTADSFNSNTSAQWRVLSVNKAAGTVELMSVEPTAQTVTLSGEDAFKNAETVLNNIGAIYGNGKGATGGRSLTVEDINQYSSYNPSVYETEYSSTGYYGGTKSYTSGNFYKETVDANANISYETAITTANSTNPVTMTQTSYYYAAKSYFSNLTIYNMIFMNSVNTDNGKSNYWLASRAVNLGSGSCGFSVRRVIGADGIGNAYVFYSGGTPGEQAYGALPVVTLNVNIQTTGQDGNGVWQLKVD